MHLTARVTADAQVKTFENQTTVVNFTLAQNKSYKNKSGEKVEQTEFIRCSYWKSAGVAKILKKGAMVEVSGFVSADTYVNKDGKHMASLNCHVDNIDLKAPSKRPAVAQENTTPAPPQNHTDDLPF